MGDLALRDVIGQYVRNNWRPRRLLLDAGTEVTSEDLMAAEIADIETVRSVVTAIWFSRRSVIGQESWELRRLTGTPYALVVVIDDDCSVEERERRLIDTVQRLAEISTRFLAVPRPEIG